MLVAVHAGAGYHSTRKEADYKELCARACRCANDVYQRTGQVIDAAAAACRVLEDSVETNAGIGSNVTLDGTVECDASIMNGSTLQFGAVGALRGVRNPIDVAAALLREQANGLLSLGRIPPSVLVGDGAARWAASRGIELVDPETMLTSSTRKCYTVYKRKIDDAESGRRSGGHAQHGQSPATISNGHSHRESAQLDSQSSDIVPPAAKHERENETKLDTVGVLCIDVSGECCAALSSGGVQLKHTGRLGHAPLFGCGCWAQRYLPARLNGTPVDSCSYGVDGDASRRRISAVGLDDVDGEQQQQQTGNNEKVSKKGQHKSRNDNKEDSLAVITSGCGEYLARVVFAKSCADCCRREPSSIESPAYSNGDSDGQKFSQHVRRYFEQEFMRSPYLVNEQRLAGVVCARWSPQRSVFDISWCHSTSSFALGYYCAAVHEEPQCFVSRLTLADSERRDGVGVYSPSSCEQVVSGFDTLIPQIEAPVSNSLSTSTSNLRNAAADV